VRSGRHRAAAIAYERRRRQAWRRGLLSAVAVLVAVAGAGFVVVNKAGGPCSTRNPILVNVASALDISSSMMRAAGEFNASRAAVDGRCVLVQVSERAPAPVLRTLIGDRVDVLPQRPDGWVADSSAWIRLARKQGAQDIGAGETVVATSPLVFATRKSLADVFAAGKTEMSWNMVFPATFHGRVQPTSQEPDIVRVPDPSQAGAGIATLAAARDIVGGGERGAKSLSAFVRWAQAAAMPDYSAMMTALDDRSFWQRPVVIVPEQSVWRYGRTASPDPIVALHPREGTINLDYPYVVTASDASKAEASRLFGEWLRRPRVQDEVRHEGFRTADGKLPPYDAGPNIPTQQPSPRPSITPAVIDEALDAWSRLAPPANILVLADVSKHMTEPIKGGGGTRWDVALKAARLGLQLFPNSTSMGLWTFADGLGGAKGYRELVGLGPMTQPANGDQFVRRSRIDELIQTLTVENRASSLDDALLSGFREVSRRYDPMMNNIVLALTAGADDGRGITGQDLVAKLRSEWNPDKPVQIIVVAFGSDYNQATLLPAANITNGSLYAADQPGQIIDVFLSALARRLCHPTCPKATVATATSD
jgi:hypothetical protein